MMITLLAMYGGACNRGPHVLAGNEPHAARLFPVVVGSTGNGGKGTSFAGPRALMERVAADYIGPRSLSGFGSGESLVDAVRDPVDDEDDDAPDDTRLLVLETEYARLLKVASRESSILSPIIRDAWDGRTLQARSRARTSIASQHHIVLIGHVTPEELRMRLADVESWSGFTNRFLFVLSERAQLIPSGGNVPATVIEAHVPLVRDNLARARTAGQVDRTPAAEDYWHDLYVDLADDAPDGLLGAVVARSAPYVLRLSLVYALAAGARQIDLEHVEAAAAMWSYSRSSAAVIFAESTGDPLADKLLAVIEAAGTDGITLADQNRKLGGNYKADRLNLARKLLEHNGKIATRTDDCPTGGRPRTVSVALNGQGLTNELSAGSSVSSSSSVAVD